MGMVGLPGVGITVCFNYTCALSVIDKLPCKTDGGSVHIILEAGGDRLCEIRRSSVLCWRIPSTSFTSSFRHHRTQETQSGKFDNRKPN